MVGLTRDRPLSRTPGIAEAFGAALLIVTLDVAVSRLLPPLPRASADAMWRLAWLRGAESLLILAYWRIRVGGLSTLGLSGAPLLKGLRVAVAGCLLLGLIAALCELAFSLILGKSFLGAIASQGRPPALPLFAAGAFFGPLFEELLFRGLLYGSLRKNAGVTLSTLLVTAAFAAMHLPSSQVPLIPTIGGIFFALSLEYSGSLLAPLLIHIAGNTAIFLLPHLYG